ncbi:GCN5 family acetyltransferase [Gordoniibacillus kamchatkensis]|uniref:GCN5 family acetyltransferase n=1 Tax=Gordoniibacillus kamchatkensis TaxID=1590651 RepID=A0ABR5AJK2_9BACL|nr:GNAT family N-acetyltransferase [Paenibacillus sp. VKM B-2647]KIL41194.1 GCN5 family acetyltransferase [Paenibacillus sp. VKM B-2647]
MPIIHVRTEDELAECFSIRKEVFVAEQGVSVEEEIDEFDASPDACRHFLLLQDGAALATARWRPYDGKTAKLQRVAVRRQHRGQGLGRELILHMENDAKALGYEATILDGQCQAESFYRKLGYEVISDKPFYDAGILHVRMKKKLQP